MSRILIVENNPDVVEVCEMILSGNGNCVDGTSDANQAYMDAVQNGYDSILLGFVLPRFDGRYPDGLEFARRLVDDEGYQGRIVLYTGFDRDYLQDRADERKLDLNRYFASILKKTSDPEELICAMR